jgi:hypothetical protein
LVAKNLENNPKAPKMPLLFGRLASIICQPVVEYLFTTFLSYAQNHLGITSKTSRHSFEISAKTTFGGTRSHLSVSGQCTGLSPLAHFQH